MGRRSRRIAELERDNARLLDRLTEAEDRARTAEYNRTRIAQQLDRLDEAMRQQARDWQAEHQRLTAALEAAERTAQAAHRQLDDALYDTDTQRALDKGADWQTRREDKPKRAPKAAL